MKIVFEVKNLTTPDHKVRDVSFQLRRHEILGFSGLMGAGRTELLNAPFPAQNRKKVAPFILMEKKSR